MLSPFFKNKKAPRQATSDSFRGGNEKVGPGGLNIQSFTLVAMLLFSHISSPPSSL